MVTKGRVGPGELLVIDTKLGKLLNAQEIGEDIKKRNPYKEWLKRNVLKLTPFEELSEKEAGKATLSPTLLLNFQKELGFNTEELESVLRVLGENGQEAVGSMGDDAPFAVFSKQHRVIYDYFRQYFAQVTNPPIDPLREAHVMSLSTSIGREMSVFYETEGMSNRVNFKSPVLLYADIQQLLNLPSEHYQHHNIDITYDINEQTLEERLHEIANETEQAVKQGAVILLLSDKNISTTRAPVPDPLAVGLVQKRLVEKNLRCDANIIVETGSTRDSHQFAVLLSLGATAIYPYLAYESLANMVQKNAISVPLHTVMLNYRNGINKGLYKIMSKMGISTISSYRCAHLFEIVGLNNDIVKLCFDGMVSRIAGCSFIDLNNDVLNNHRFAWKINRPLKYRRLSQI